MPEICRFYGIIVRMFLIDREHPPRHIHIKYGEYVAVMELDNLNFHARRLSQAGWHKKG